MNKDIKKSIKALKKWFTAYYAKFVGQIQSGYITTNDVDFFIQQELSPGLRIAALKALKPGTVAPLGRAELIFKLKNDLVALTKEAARLTNTQADSAEIAQEVLVQLDNINTRYAEQSKILKDLERGAGAVNTNAIRTAPETQTPDCVSDEQKKRKIGRPKKGENNEKTKDDHLAS